VSDSGQTLPGSKAGEYFTGWLKQQWTTWAPGTAKSYKSKLDAFVKHLGPRAERSISAITANDIRSFIAVVAERSSPKTANNTLAVLKIAFTAASKAGVIDKSPAAMVDRMKAARNERRAFTMDELRKILGLATEEWRTMILTGLYTGLRLGDCAGLRWTNVDIERAELTVTTQKTGKTVILPLAKPLLKHILTLPMGDDPRAFLCPGLADQHMARLSSQFHDMLVDAGLLKAYTRTQGGTHSDTRKQNQISFHCLRHTATSLLKNAGVSNAVTMDLIGHTSEAVSMNYTHIEADTKRHAVDLMADVFDIEPKVKE
jgi:integrase